MAGLSSFVLFSILLSASSDELLGVSERTHQELVEDGQAPPPFPLSFDWRNVNGTSYVSPIRNQNLPHYCRCSRPMAITSVMADRINIKRKGQLPSAYLSVQELIDCQYAALCGVGASEMSNHTLPNSESLFRYIYKNGVVDESCNNYRGVTLLDGCNSTTRCGTCLPNGKCVPIENYRRWNVSSYQHIKSDPKTMRNELYQKGPLVCEIFMTPALQNYKTGIFKQHYHSSVPNTNYTVAVTGYGVDNGLQYWIARPSYGYEWGDKGWFKIVTSEYEDGFWSLDIEANCHSPDVVLE